MDFLYIDWDFFWSQLGAGISIEWLLVFWLDQHKSKQEITSIDEIEKLEKLN